jgi:uncharacterized protein YlaI
MEETGPIAHKFSPTFIELSIEIWKGCRLAKVIQIISEAFKKKKNTENSPIRVHMCHRATLRSQVGSSVVRDGFQTTIIIQTTQSESCSGEWERSPVVVQVNIRWVGRQLGKLGFRLRLRLRFRLGLRLGLGLRFGLRLRLGLFGGRSGFRTS